MVENNEKDICQILEYISGEECTNRGGGAGSRPCTIVIQHLRGSGVDRQTDKTQIRHPSVVNDIMLSGKGTLGNTTHSTTGATITLN